MSQNSDPKKSVLRKAGQTRLNASAGHAFKFSGRTWCEIQIRERKGPSRGVIQKSEPHERNPCAPGFEEQQPEETSRQKDCISKVAWNLARKYASLSRTLNYVLFSCEGARDTEAGMFIVYSGASMHNAEQRRIKLRYNGYFEKVQKTHMRLTATG